MRGSWVPVISCGSKGSTPTGTRLRPAREIVVSRPSDRQGILSAEASCSVIASCPFRTTLKVHRRGEIAARRSSHKYLLSSQITCCTTHFSRTTEEHLYPDCPCGRDCVNCAPCRYSD